MPNTNKSVPFFARYLEGQEFPRVKTDIKAGIIRTLKYPSDIDEDVTLKYPSDGDEAPTS
ncbi:MAG TPA: microviridin/marinostatin family tricyclic proteinase inhibitor [Blastocatellia bacterium]|nr:microviridin/marinostatin family tricyclic proteinase inhibitor [Blastocatellia bacterium]